MTQEQRVAQVRKSKEAGLPRGVIEAEVALALEMFKSKESDDGWKKAIEEVYGHEDH